MSIKRTTWLLSVLFVFSLALGAQEPRQRAYVIGHKVGYDRGYNDAQGGQAANLAGSSEYRDRTAGWVGGISSEEYGNNYRAGFTKGYKAGYGAASRGAEPDPDRRLTTFADAYRNGYEVGYEQGHSSTGDGYALDSSAVYQDATAGFDAAGVVPLAQYRPDFRQGFVAGYSDGYYGHVYEERPSAPRIGSPQGQVVTSPFSGGSGSENYGSGSPNNPYSTVIMGYGSGFDYAFNRGYREGYTRGRAESYGPYRIRQAAVYRDATAGYDPLRDGSLESYQARFQQGYLAGYDEGYYGPGARGAAPAR